MKKLVTIACSGLIGVATLLLTGCETDSIYDNNLTITPASVSLHNGDYADFAASGGSNYTWNLPNQSWGFLSNVTGPNTSYNSAEPDDNHNYDDHNSAAPDRYNYNHNYNDYDDNLNNDNNGSRPPDPIVGQSCVTQMRA